MIVGYASTDQAAGLAAQERDLTAAGAERIFGEQISSTAKRAKLAECLAFMRDGDVLAVTKPDRLARTAELLSIEADLSNRGIGLADPVPARREAKTGKLQENLDHGVRLWKSHNQA
jgi:DNA invertase Pin-like site-specific DNA recombinase